jgi:hypothetical protein
MEGRQELEEGKEKQKKKEKKKGKKKLMLLPSKSGGEGSKQLIFLYHFQMLIFFRES